MKKIVIKVGSSIIADPTKNKISKSRIRQLCSNIAQLSNNYKFIIVSSGAIACALVKYGIRRRPTGITALQSLAAIGQIELMKLYQQIFSYFAIEIAQVLLTWDDFSSRKRYLNAKNTLEKLLAMNVIPVINENDVVAIDEIKFGDNDRLSALVACLIDAQVLIILSDVTGIYDRNNRLIREVSDITTIRQYCFNSRKDYTVGGMVTKLEAAEIVSNFGIDLIIADGRRKDPLLEALNSEKRTIIYGKKRLKARKHWIAYGVKVKGEIIIDEGAKTAIKEKGKSILASGIVDVKGEFDKGDVIAIKDREGNDLGRGIANYPSKDIAKIRGKKSDEIFDILGYKEFDEVIHRDNLVLI